MDRPLTSPELEVVTRLAARGRGDAADLDESVCAVLERAGLIEISE